MTMPQTRHYEMKDSGVEWIGKMPRHWQIQKAKYYITVTNGSDPVTEGDIPVYGSGSKSFRTCGEYKEGPTVLVGRKGSIDKPRYVTGRYWNVDTAFDVKTKGFDLRLYYYLATCFDYQFYMSQTTLPSMTQTNYRNMFLPVPPLPEQAAIAAYLDEKCATIDAIIAEAKASIEEYKSWKASVIFETVTKGLNPNAEMKDSGVEWIGRVSKGWKIVPAKFFMRVQAGYPFDSERFDNSQGIPLIRIRDITSGHTETFYNGDYPEEYVVHNNDLLVGMDGDFNVRWWQGGEAVLNQRCCRIFAQKGLILRYFYFLLPFYLKQVNELAYSTTVKHLANGDIGNADICLPPQNEQTAIAAYLDSKCAAIDGIILEKEELIRELENYRRSLIFEVVTGKRRVC